MVKLVGDLCDLIVFVTGTLDIEIAFGECLDLLFELRKGFETLHDPEIEENDQHEDD